MSDTSKIRELNGVAAIATYDWSGWTDWHQLKSIDTSILPRTPGAYVLSTTRSIDRAIGTDPLGILDIGETGKGKTGTLVVRIERLRWCATMRGKTGHMAGWRFAFFRFERHFPVESLRVRWISTATKADARDRESRVMLAYLMRYCELPPLNYSFNWDAFEKIGWNVFDDPTCFGPPVESK